MEIPSLFSKGVDLDPLWCSWFSGFVDGEGYFQVYPRIHNNRNILISLTIRLREDDEMILREIRNTLQCGHVNHIDATCERIAGLKSSNRFSWRVSDIEHIIFRVVPLFDQYPLHTKKLFDYQIWRKIAFYVSHKDHLISECRAEILELSDTLKKSRMGPYELYLRDKSSWIGSKD